jgi:lipopolysaccharide transport system ATP-binding protein
VAPRIAQKEELWALKDVSFEVQQGERLGIVGRNGAGKSTLLKVLSRITAPTTGRVSIKGRLASLLEVGTGFHPELTGRENIFFNGAVLGMTRSEIRRKFDEIVDFSGVERFLDVPVKRYSSGMYVRLAFAVAANLEPEILIIDEVLAVGDAEFQRKCLGKMKEVGTTGRTVLFVSHNMAAVKSLCSKGLLIDGGQIKASGTPEEVIRQYLSQSLDIDGQFENSSPDRESREISVRRAWVSSDQREVPVEININIEYEVRPQRIGAVLAARITNESGAVVSTLLDTDADLGRFEKSSGSYETVCRVPGQLLVPGLYYVTLSIADMKSTRYEYLENVLSFSVPFNEASQNSFSGRDGSLLFVSPWPLRRLDG